jgi:hypothetical protein
MRAMRWWCAPIVLAAACATAKRGGSEAADANNGNGDANGKQDATTPPPDSASGPDAAIAITLSETSNDTLAYGDTIACGNNLTGSTKDNIWYRAFQLSDYPAITGGLHITAVKITVQDALSSAAVKVKVGGYSGSVGGATIDTSMISSLALASFTPANTSGQSGAVVTVPVTADISAGGKFMIELVAPDMDVDSNQHAFYPGTTTASETHPAYWSTGTTACGPSTPETMTAAGATGRLILDVIGTH